MTPEEFRRVILPEGRRLYALAFRFLNNREEAEDAVQEVMMKLWEDRKRLRDYANPAAWATTVTRNMCIDLLRRRRKMSHEEIDSVMMTGRVDEGTGSASDNREAAMLITGIVERMKEPYRSAVILRDMEGYSYEEAAVVLQTSVETLRTTLSRARKSIREELEKIYSYGTGRDKGTA
ncbi:MAG: RNA polymerase sigma factor [Bacteroidales bacterium]|nr:RNA polymerase sigma factor [Bacteroidales bacterium]